MVSGYFRILLAGAFTKSFLFQLDLMWSDPEESIETWQISPRGAGWLFGSKIAAEVSLDNSTRLASRR